MNNVTLTIDGKQIEVAAGTTILKAAQENGIEIPTLCYHPRLRPLGHCRLCVVEIEGIAAPVTSCDHPVQEGMVVTTTTPALEAIRKEIISLLLCDHPYEDCLTCEKSGNCDLQERAYSWQIELPEFIRSLPVTDDDNPYIVRDEAKCILCGRCYSVCADFARRSVFGLVGNGVETRVTPVKGEEPAGLDAAGCIYCGQCVDVCPVGALTERDRAAAGREWEMSVHPGVCLECSLGCAVQRHFAGGRLLRVTAETEGEPGGWLCIKGKFNPAGAAADSEPLSAPLLRGKKGFVEVSYDRALQEAARAFSEIKKKEGAEALAVIAGGRCSNEESFLLQKLAREAMGTPHIDLGAGPGWVDAVAAVEEITGPGVCGPSLEDIQNAAAIFVIGEKLEESNPVAAMAVERACRLGRAVLVQVGGDEKEFSAWDRVVLVPQPGAEGELFKELTALITKKTEADGAAEHTRSISDLERAAELLRDSGSVVLVCPSYFEAAGRDWIEPFLETARAAGRLARGQSSLLFLSEEGNARGALETGGTPGYRPGYDRLDGKAGLDRAMIMASAKTGEIKGIFACLEGLEETFAPGLDFLAVLCSSRSAVPAEANVVFPVLPAQLKEGTFTSSAGLQQQNHGAAAAGGIWPEWQVVAALIRALGAPAECSSLQEVQEEIKRVAGGR